MASKKTTRADATDKATKAKAGKAAKTQAADTMMVQAPPPAPTPEPTASQKLSALDAAARVLGETGQAMTTKELIGVMAARGYWTSPKGLTPHATLYAAIAREIQAKAGASRFVKVGPGTFGLRATT